MIASPLIRLIAIIGIYFSSLFAVLQILKLFFEPRQNAFPLFLMIFIGFVIFKVNSYLRKTYPGRFLGKKMKNTLAYAILSLAFSFFILSFFHTGTKVLWQDYISENEAVKTLSQSLMAVLIQFLIVFIAVFPVFIIWFFYSRKKGFFINFSIAAVYVLVFLVLMPYLAATHRVILGIDPARYLDNFTNNVVPGVESVLYIVVSFIVGSIPLGWFSELFIGTLYEKIGHNRVK